MKELRDSARALGKAMDTEVFDNTESFWERIQDSLVTLTLTLSLKGRGKITFDNTRERERRTLWQKK